MLPSKRMTKRQLLLALERQRLRLDEAEEVLRAIHSGAVDALVVTTEEGQQIFTLQGADHSYRLLVEGMEEGAIVLTNSGSIIYSNRRFAEMVQKPLEKVIGSDIFTWVAQESQERFRSLLGRNIATERRREMMFVASDGTPLPVHLSASSYAQAGAPDYVCMVATDLRELNERKMREVVAQAASDYTRRLIEANRDPQVVIDAKLTITDLNVAMERITGIDREKLIGSCITACFTEPDVAQARLREVFVHGSISDQPLSIRHLSGKVTDLLYNANLYHDNHGNILGALTTARDITQRKQVEAREAVERLNRDKDLFLANISHELRTPVLSILQFAVLARRRWMEGRPEETMAMLDALLGGKERLLRFITNLESLARIHVGLWPFQFVPGDLISLVQEVVCDKRLRFAAKNLQWRLSAPETVTACFDLPSVTIMLNELLDNAGLFSPMEGVVELQVTESGGQVQISILDTGPGIPAGEEEIIFSPFIESSLTRSNAGGTGIGLSVARGLAQQHGGTILMANRRDCQGAEVTLCLPCDVNKARGLTDLI
ncbi:MAG: PAS domain-containing sensor histidine kinase [Magnetococcus sp. YQC-3]